MFQYLLRPAITNNRNNTLCLHHAKIETCLCLRVNYNMLCIMYNAYVRVLDDKITGFKTATAGVDSAPSAIGLHGGLAQIIYIRTIVYMYMLG